MSEKNGVAIICDPENCTSKCDFRGKDKICPYLTSVRAQRIAVEALLR